MTEKRQSIKDVQDQFTLPPRLRAIAKVVHDVDDESFPNLRVADGSLRDEGVDELLDELGYRLTPQERKQFSRAYEEYGLQLKGVDLTLLGKNRVVGVLKLTTAIDAESSMAGIPVNKYYESVIHCHGLILSKVVNVELTSNFSEVLDLFITRLESLLGELLGLVKGRSEVRRHEVVNPELIQRFAALNACIMFLTQHLEWFVDVGKYGPFFDCRILIDDTAACRMWEQYVGRQLPACSVAAFEPALSAFPEWSREALRSALNFLDDGVVSIYSLERVLKIWGPFSLLDRNFRNDLSHCMVSLKKPAEVVQHELIMAYKRHGEPGEFCLTMSRVVGNLTLVMVTPTGKLRKMEVNRENGCWNIPGIAPDDHETMCSACKSSPAILKSAKGDNFGVPSRGDSEHNESFSILHRACFQNNTAYVQRLLQCGGGIIVNTAVADPSITSDFEWTPLLCAVNNPNGDPYDAVTMLLEHGADVNFADRSTSTALYYAIVNGYPRVVNLLLNPRETRGKVFKGAVRKSTIGGAGRLVPTASFSKNGQDPLDNYGYSTYKGGTALLNRAASAYFRSRKAPVSSSSCNPLLLALGAHLFNLSERDNRRVCGVLPIPDVVRELLPTIQNRSLIYWAVKIVEGKMAGETTPLPPMPDRRLMEAQVSINERPIEAAAPDSGEARTTSPGYRPSHSRPSTAVSLTPPHAASNSTEELDESVVLSVNEYYPSSLGASRSPLRSPKSPLRAGPSFILPVKEIKWSSTPKSDYTWNFEGKYVPIMTAEQEAANLLVIKEHDKFCALPQHKNTMKEVLRLLRMHSFYLSCQPLVE